VGGATWTRAHVQAVSQQIQAIQEALGRAQTDSNVTVEVTPGKPVPLNPAVGVFITMNPGYAGRSLLPDNLKRLFRNLAMTKPDYEMIAQVMLFSQGFRSSAALAQKIVPLFQLCDQQLSKQSHYDFTLRAIKQVLTSAGNIKRSTLERLRAEAKASGAEVNEAALSASVNEQDVVIKSLSQTMVPKLVGNDNILLVSLLKDVFPNAEVMLTVTPGLREKIVEVCEERHFIASDKFVDKMLQLHLVTEISHGLMLVGPSGTGKSTAWTILLEALRRFEKREATAYVIDPKAISKAELYGFLDPDTRAWTDGVLTSIIRKVISNQLGEIEKRQWIVFDGDVDPVWVENLNSVLDDNKLLTLPNGERLILPECMRIMFEVQDLDYATAATVSRCGMIWFSPDIVDTRMQFDRYLAVYRKVPLDQSDPHGSLAVQGQVAGLIAPFFRDGGLVERALECAEGLHHIMEYSHDRAINTLFCSVKSIARNIVAANSDRPAEFPLTAAVIEKYVGRQFLNYLMWALVGDTSNPVRKQLSEMLSRSDTAGVDLPQLGGDEMIIDYTVPLTADDAGSWLSWTSQVPEIDIPAEKIAGTDVVIPTVDTERHVDMLFTWLKDHLPVVLCGPPGSGKTMTLVSALRKSPDFVAELVNFSSSTSPQVILETLAQHCEFKKTAKGLVQYPRDPNPNKWLVVFCDECNLPATDDYNTVRVITFLRQLVERHGYWKPDTCEWVTISRIQFVGACNPPTDPGRVPLARRFLRHVPVIYVDYPSASSYKQIYGTFNRALMNYHLLEKNVDFGIAKYAEPLTNAMVDFFMQTQERFTADMQPFYIYSPREMTRWIKGIKSCIWNLEAITGEDVVRIWAHEALRLFCDRLVHAEEREWTNRKIDECARRYFPTLDTTAALRRPILFSSWTNTAGNYVSVERDALRTHVAERMEVFYEEVLDVPLVLFDDVLDHVLRIDRVFKQNQGHVLCIGVAGGGKTTLSRFCAWLNKLTVYQVKVHNQYTAEDFDDDLRNVLRRSGVEGERIAFIMDEGNVMDTAFLERMNTLLANGEVPGLFKEDEYKSLMAQCKQASSAAGEVLDSEAELYTWFSKQILKNLHVVFTMNPSQEEGGMQDRASTSPALFNRMVLDWFGDWSNEAAHQVAAEFTTELKLDKPEYAPPPSFPAMSAKVGQSPTHREAVSNALVYFHSAARAASTQMRNGTGISTHITPRHMLEGVNQFVALVKEKVKGLEEEKDHLGVGLRKIRETFAQVGEMEGELAGERAKLDKLNSEGDIKMATIVQKSMVAEEKKKAASENAAILAVKVAEAEKSRADVKVRLAGVGPTVAAASQAVAGIQKKDLKEMGSLAHPPKSVSDTCEAVMVLIGWGKGVKGDWKLVRNQIKKPDFIDTVKNLKNDVSKITSQIERNLHETYFGDGKPDEQLISEATRGSQAAGELMTWALAMLKYVKVSLEIKPMRDQLAQLNEDASVFQARQDENTAALATLGQEISAMKADLGKLTSKQEVIKMQLQKTEEKVHRAQKLLDNLRSEKERWTKQDADFGSAMKYVIGDSLISSAFLAYAGYFDQSYRAAFMHAWKAHLRQVNIEFSGNLGIVDHLATPDDQLTWTRHGLPADELCQENAVMLTRGIRYPLIIDPAGPSRALPSPEADFDPTGCAHLSEHGSLTRLGLANKRQQAHPPVRPTARVSLLGCGLTLLNTARG
jgi:dynein heavy chain 1